MSRKNLKPTYLEKYKHIKENIQEQHKHKYEHVQDKNIDMKNLN